MYDAASIFKYPAIVQHVPQTLEVIVVLLASFKMTRRLDILSIKITRYLGADEHFQLAQFGSFKVFLIFFVILLNDEIFDQKKPFNGHVEVFVHGKARLHGL